MPEPAGVEILADEHPSPHRRLRFVQRSDGSARLRLKPLRVGVNLTLFGLLGVTSLFIGGLFLTTIDREGGAAILIGGAILFGGLAASRRFLWYLAGGDELLISRAGLVRRHRMSLVRSEVYLLSEVSTVVIAGEGDEAKLVLQLGRRTVHMAQKLSLTTDELRWAAGRLRSAIDRARAAA